MSGPSGVAITKPTESIGVSVIANAVTMPARSSPVMRFAVAAAASVATTPQARKPSRTQSGFAVTQSNGKMR